jgi:RNA polymerase sigma-70 factor (ECF subfamily)
MPVSKEYNLRKLDDEKLMKYLQHGDISAFNELYHRYSCRLLHYYYRMLGGNEHKAQDLLQDTFLKMIEKSHLFQTQKCFSTWIFTLAHNLVKNEYRRMHVRNIVDDNPDMDALSDSHQGEYHQAEQKVDKTFFESALCKELEKLDYDQKCTFTLRHQQHFSIKEISEILDILEGTVKSRLFYTTRKLANRLKEYNPNSVEVFDE